MESFKTEEQEKKKTLKAKIESQKKQINEKERQIEDKHIKMK